MLMRYSLPEGRELFAFIGRFTDQKAPLEYLEVVRRWRADPTLHFVMVGSGELKTACDEFVRLHDLHNVTRIDHIEDLGTLYPLLSCVVVSSVRMPASRRPRVTGDGRPSAVDRRR